jgi:hypothetical protein
VGLLSVGQASLSLMTFHGCDDNMIKQPHEPVPTVTVPIKIKMTQVDKLRSEAKRRGVRADELVSRILTNVVADNLIAAVIDL